MDARDFTDNRALITFTSDFHELLRGGLRPGLPVLLRYDPRRVLPPDTAYTFGDPAHQFFAHVPGDVAGETRVVPLISRVGVLDDPDYDVTGDGNVLTADLKVPMDATFLSVWFSHRGPEGGEEVDDDYGRTFVFGFPSLYVPDIRAEVGRPPEGDQFTLTVKAAPEVRRVGARIRVVDGRTMPPIDQDLRSRGPVDGDGRATWVLDPIVVGSEATVQFKVYFWVAGRRFKDDNDGRYYLASPVPPEVVPPPPPQLAEALKRWR